MLLPVLLALLLAAAPATSNAIIWTGTADPDAARAQLEAWPKDEATWSRRVKLAEGYPRLVKSDELPGLKPGFHVILLGICNAEKTRPRTRTLKDLYPATYWRPLTTAQPDACPEVYCTDTDAMAAVPGGVFLEGADKHSKELGAFEVDRFEVSSAAYAACVALKACSPLAARESDRRPALATYKQAWDYCGFQGKRLVRGDEWEKAGRGTDGRRYPWGARVPDCSLGQGPECGSLTWIGRFPAWATPYGLQDMFGNAAEWVDGAVVTQDNVKRFPTRGEASTSKDFALWLAASAPIDAQRGFRCARACVWKPGVALPKLPDPIDVELPSDPAHQAVADPALREALELWRAERVKDLGEGATVEWRELTASSSWDLVTNYVRERVGGRCVEGPIAFTIGSARGRTQVTRSPRRVGPIACCDAKCGPPSPAEAVLRFLEALRSNESARIDPFIPEKGLLYEYQYNDDPKERTRYLRGEVTSFGRLEDADLGAISCKPFDASGVSECDISNSTVTVKQRKKDTVITRVSQHISEGC